MRFVFRTRRSGYSHHGLTATGSDSHHGPDWQHGLTPTMVSSHHGLTGSMVDWLGQTIIGAGDRAACRLKPIAQPVQSGKLSVDGPKPNRARK